MSENQMPTMNTEAESETTLPTSEIETTLPGEVETETSSEETETEANPEEHGATLPTSEPGLPSFKTPGKSDNEKEIDVPVTGNKSIEVVAIRKGFYNQNRIEEGKVFRVKNFDHVGTWTKCTDPAIERLRLEKINKKKAKK